MRRGLSSNWTENRGKERCYCFFPRISSLCTLNDLQAVLTRRAIRRDVPVERLPGNAEFGAQVSHLRFLLPHGSHGQAHLWRRHFEGRTAFSSAGAGRSQPGSGSLGNQVSFKLCERSEDAEHELPRRRRGVDRRAVAGEHLETDAAHAEVVNDIDEVAQVAAQPIELPNDQGVPTAQGLEGGIESRPRIEAAGGAVLVEPARGNSGGPKSVALQIGALRSVRLRHTHVADLHCVT
jgi:hypothetical protein